MSDRTLIESMSLVEELGAGLPLLAWLSRSELESVIAHEFGHHVSGDLALGPWVHRTRRTIGGALDHRQPEPRT